MLPVPLAILTRSTEGGGSLLAGRRQLRWTVVTDRGVGGKSEAAFELLRDPPPVDAEEKGGQETPTLTVEGGTTAATSAEEDEQPLAVFSGRLSTLRPSADPTCVHRCTARCRWM